MLIIQSIALIQSSRLQLNSLVYHSLSQIKFFSLFQLVCQSNSLHFSSLSTNPTFCFFQSSLPIQFFALFQHVFQSTLSLFQSVFQYTFSLSQSVIRSTLFFVPVSLPIHPFLCSSQSSNPPFFLFQSVIQSTLFSLQSFSLPKPISLFLYIFDLFRHFCWCQICLLYIPSFFIYIYQALLLAVFHLYLCRV